MPDGAPYFNTWSVLNFFANPQCDFINYWYESGGLPQILRKSLLRKVIAASLQAYVRAENQVSVGNFVNPTDLLTMDAGGAVVPDRISDAKK